MFFKVFLIYVRSASISSACLYRYFTSRNLNIQRKPAECNARKTTQHVIWLSVGRKLFFNLFTLINLEMMKYNNNIIHHNYMSSYRPT